MCFPAGIDSSPSRTGSPSARGAQGSVDLYINHETSKVPFPYVTAAPTAANGENDFDNAQVSQLRLNQHSAGVLNGSFAISSASGYQRFCSNFLATSRESFTREILFTNEESPDYVYRQEDVVAADTRRSGGARGGCGRRTRREDRAASPDLRDGQA